MLSGFLSSGNLYLTHQLKLFWPHAVSMAPIREGAIYEWKIVFLMIHSIENYRYWLFWCQWWSDHQEQECFWGNWALEAVGANEVAEATEVNEAEEVSKTWNVTSEDFRVFQVIEFNILTELWKVVLNFSIFSVGGCWGRMWSKKFQMID